MKAPEKIFRTTTYLDNKGGKTVWKKQPVAGAENIEYTRTDAFVEKMARFLENKLYDRVEIQVFGTVIPSLTSKKAFIEEFTNYMKGE